MRPQNRPFVVEIKKTKRGGAPVAGAPAAPAPATWAEQFEQATALNDSAARKAAEAVFSAPRPASTPIEQVDGREVFRRDEPRAPEASGRTGRILLALEPAPAALSSQPDLPDDGAEAAAPRRPARRPVNGNPVATSANAIVGAAAERDTRPAGVAKSARTVPAPVSAAMNAPAISAPVITTPAPVLATPDQASLNAAAAVPARKGPWRRGAATPLARGEKWKRRLPQVLR